MYISRDLEKSSNGNRIPREKEKVKYTELNEGATQDVT